MIVSIPALQARVDAAEGINTGCIFAKLMAKGDLGYEPALVEPWQTLTSKSLAINHNMVTIFSGSRKFDKSENSERFSRNGSDYYASTTTYYVSGFSALPAPSEKGFGPFQVRTVYLRDPAVGQWQAEAAFVDKADTSILRTLSQGDCPQQVVTDASRAAAVSAWGKIESNLLGSGTIAKTKDPEVLEFPNARLTLYTGKANLFFSGDTNHTLMNSARQTCAGVKKNGKNWRLITWNDFSKITTRLDPVRWTFPDTPDGRYFKGLKVVGMQTQAGYKNTYFLIDNGATWYNMVGMEWFGGGKLTETSSVWPGMSRVLCVADI